MSDEPIKESYIKLISQFPAAADLSPSDLLLLQDVSDETEPYKKATALSVAQTAISDETTASDTTWSSAKIQEGLDNALPDFASLPEVTPAKTDLLLVKDSEGYKKSQIKSIAEAAGLKTVNITMAEYEALSEAEKMNGTYYNITDTETDTHDMIQALQAELAELKDSMELHDGDTVSFDAAQTISKGIIANGFVSDSSTAIYFCIQLPKSYAGNKNVTCNSLVIKMRTAQGGYIEVSNTWAEMIGWSGYTTTANINDNILTFYIKKTTGSFVTAGTSTAIPNNSCVSVSISSYSVTI